MILRRMLGRKRYTGNGKTQIWEDEGSRKEFKKNKKKLGPDWYYYYKEISFEFNSNGFRAPEFDTIDWANSVVVFGDSFVSGDGNPIEDIATSLLQDMLKMPVINLGASGTGIDLACWNSLLLHETYPHPRAVVQLWSNIDRYAEFITKKSFKDDIGSEYTHHLSGDPRPILGRSNYCAKGHNWAERSKMYVLADRALWRNKLPYYEASMFEHTAKQVSVDFLKTIDLGRDLDHWGWKSNIAAAETIATNLKKQGL